MLFVMGNFLWVKTKHREELLKSLENIPEYGKKSKSELLELALDEFVKKHGESKNPQTQISLFQTNGVSAIPNIYEDNKDKWNKFYSLLSKDDYKELDVKINELVNRHNKELSRFT